MTLCLDIHTHHAAPQPLGVISSSAGAFQPLEGQKYSVGFHPWDTVLPGAVEWNRLESVAALPEVVAIGECGIDKLKGGPLFRQMIIFKKQIEISENLGKPLIIHDVKAHDIIVGLKKDLNPTQKWLVHGFRGKPTVAKMLTDAGIYISFGEKFNIDALRSIPKEFILAETDESPLTIGDIIANLSAALGFDALEMIKENTHNFLS